METIKNKLIEKKFFNEDDFIFEKNNILINYDKFSNLLDLENDGLNDYVKLTNIKNFLIKKNNIKIFNNKNFNIIIELLEIFNLLVIKESDSLKFIASIEPNVITILEQQYIFTYTFANFIQDNYPNYSIKIEDDFLNNFQELIKKSISGSRTDIVIPEIKMVIEFDEKAHQQYENSINDKIRNSKIKHFGYDVYHFKENDDIFDFCKNIKKKIQKKQVILDLSKYSDFIITRLLEDGVCNDKELLKLLTTEQCDDIINRCSPDKIGSIPRNIKLKEHVFNWIGVVDSDENKKEKQKIYDMLEESDHKYEFNNIQDDYILSPNAFEQLLNKLDVEIYEKIAIIRETYRKIKNNFLYDMFQSFIEMIENNTDLVSSFIILCNHLNDNQNKNEYNENNKKDKIIEELKNKIEFLEQKIESLQKNLELKKNII